jgi:hypothetical protein
VRHTRGLLGASNNGKQILNKFSTALLALALPCIVAAEPILDEDTQKLLVDAVTAAAERDFYDMRCRSDESGRYIDNLNKELVGKFRMTVLQVEDNLFPEGSYSRAKKRLQRDFLAKLKSAGGCKEAKKAGMRERLRERYDKLMQQIDKLP